MSIFTKRSLIKQASFLLENFRIRVDLSENLCYNTLNIMIKISIWGNLRYGF